MGAAELKQNVIFLIIDHVTVSHTLRISPLFNCVCNYAHKLQDMDVICCSDMSDLDSMIVNLELPLLISGLEFKMSVVL